MLVHGVNVEQVEVHAPHDAGEYRHERSQEAIAVHPLQLGVDALLLPHQLAEAGQHRGVFPVLRIHQVQVVLDQPDG